MESHYDDERKRGYEQGYLNLSPDPRYPHLEHVYMSGYIAGNEKRIRERREMKVIVTINDVPFQWRSKLESTDQDENE